MSEANKVPATDMGVRVARVVYTADGWLVVPDDNPAHVRLRMADDERAALTLSVAECEAVEARLGELEVRALTADNGRLF